MKNKFIKLFEEFSDNKKTLTLYKIISYVDEDDSEILYHGTDYDDAKKEFDDCNELYSDDEYFQPFVILNKYENIYKFVYELDDDESVEDYPIDIYYDDTMYYELLEEGEAIELDYKYFNSHVENDDKIKDKIKDIKHQTESEFHKKYNKYIHIHEVAGYMKTTNYYYFVVDKNGNMLEYDMNKKLLNYNKEYKTYNNFNDNNFKISEREYTSRNFENYNNENIVFQVRISDHSQNVNNINNIVDTSASFVINYENDTYKKYEHEKGFYHSEYYFTEGDYKDAWFYGLDINDDNDRQVEYLISEIVKYIDNSLHDIKTYYKNIINKRDKDE